MKRGYYDFSELLSAHNTVYIGRGVVYVDGTYNSIWKNPFSTKKFGREKCVEMHKEYILSNPELLAKLPELCHRHILLDLISNLK